MGNLAGRTTAARLVEPYDFDDLAGGYLTFWISAISPSYYLLDGSSQVETAYDRSPRGQDATQSTSGSRPLIATQGGVDWFDFSAGNDYLSTAPSPGTDSFVAPTITGSRTAFASIYLPYSTHTSARRAILESYTEYYVGAMEISAGNDLETNIYDGSVETVTDADNLPLETVQLVAFRYQPDDFLSLWREGSSVGTPNAIQTPAVSSADGWRVGVFRDANARFFDGYIGEIAVIDRYLTDAEMAIGFELLEKRWG